MFSHPHPQYITPSTPLPSSITALREAAIIPLTMTKQPKGYAVGFFEQGIFLGLSVMAVVVLPTAGWGLYTAGRLGWRWAVSKRAI